VGEGHVEVGVVVVEVGHHSDIGVDASQAEVGVVDLGDDRSVPEPGVPAQVRCRHPEQGQRIPAGAEESSRGQRRDRALPVASGDSDAGPLSHHVGQEVGAVPPSAGRVGGKDLGLGRVGDRGRHHGHAGLEVGRRVVVGELEAVAGQPLGRVRGGGAVAAGHLRAEVPRRDGQRSQPAAGDSDQVVALASERTSLRHGKRMSEVLGPSYARSLAHLLLRT
jgi:hypothetical protein